MTTGSWTCRFRTCSKHLSGTWEFSIVSPEVRYSQGCRLAPVSDDDDVSKVMMDGVCIRETPKPD